ncbi:uncharacterized protein LOC100181469 [Ciona intestinalis]
MVETRGMGAMFVYSVLVVLFGCVNNVVLSGDAFDTFMGETPDCNKQCAANMDEAAVSACDRGCRLYTICEWMSVPVNLNSTLEECNLACDEAYSTDATACKFGCSSAVPAAQKRQDMLSNQKQHIELFTGDLSLNDEPSQDDSIFSQSDDLFSQLFNHPAMQATDRIMQSMMQSASDSMQFFNSLMSSPSGTEIIDVNVGGKHQVFVIEYGRRNPEINTQYPGFNKQLMLNTDSIGSKTTLDDRVESNLQTNANMRSYFSPDLKIEGQFLTDDDEYYWSNVHTHTWDCLMRKYGRYGFPELALITFWMCTVCVLFILCVAQCTSKPKKLSINGDLAYIKDRNGDLPSYTSLYPCEKGPKKSLFYLASVVPSSEKAPLLE